MARRVIKKPDQGQPSQTVGGRRELGEDISPGPDKGVGKKIADFFFGPAIKAGKQGLGAIKAGRQDYGEVPAMESYRKAKQAQQVTGPEREGLLQKSRQLAGTSETYQPEQKVKEWLQFEPERKIKPSAETPVGRWWQSAKAVAPTQFKGAANIGSYLAPMGTAAKGIPVTKGASIAAGTGWGPSAARWATSGATEGVLEGFARSDKGQELKNALTTGVISGMFNVGAGSGRKLVSSTWDLLTDKLPSHMRGRSFDLGEDEARKTLEGISDLTQKHTDEKELGAARGGYEKMVDWGSELYNKANKQIKKITRETWATEDVFPNRANAEGFVDEVRYAADQYDQALKSSIGTRLRDIANKLDEELFIAGKPGAEKATRKVSGLVDSKDIFDAKKYISNLFYDSNLSARSSTKTVMNRLIGTLRGNNKKFAKKGVKFSDNLADYNRLLNLQGISRAIEQTARNGIKKADTVLGEAGDYMMTYGPLVSVMGLISGQTRWAVPGAIAFGMKQLRDRPRVQQALYDVGKAGRRAIPRATAEKLQNLITGGFARGAGEVIGGGQ